MVFHPAAAVDASITGVLEPTNPARKIADDPFGMERAQAQLMVCVYARDASGVRAIFAQNDTAKLIDSLRAPKYFPLHAAALADSSAVLNALIDVLPNGLLDVRDPTGCTPLMCASQHGHVVAIHTLLAGKARVDIMDQTGCSALMWAAISGFVDAVKVLLSYEDYAVNSAQPAGIDTQNDNGDTALILAIRAGHYDVVDALMERGANVNIANARGERALSVAVSLGRHRIVGLLCRQGGADVDAADHEGITALMCAADYADRTYDSSMLSFLVAQQANIELTDRDGCSALLRAAKGHSDLALECLIDAGARLCMTDAQGCSAVMLAAAHNNLLALRFLLKQRGVMLCTRDACGRTALFHAVEARHHEIVAELLRHGANIQLHYDVIDATVLTLAQRSGDLRMVALLQEADLVRAKKEAADASVCAGSV